MPKKTANLNASLLEGDHFHALEQLVPGLGFRINSILTEHSHGIASLGGHTGPALIQKSGAFESIQKEAPSLKVGAGRIAQVADAIDDKDAPNLAQVRRIIRGARLDAVEQALANVDEPTPVVGADVAPPWFIGVSLKLEETVNDTVVQTDNEVLAFGFFLPYDTSVSTIVTRVNAGGGGSHGVGLYTTEDFVTASLLVDTGPVTSGVVQTNRTSVTATDLPAGYYYMAQTNGSGGGAPSITHLVDVIGPSAGDRLLLNSGIVRYHRSTDGVNGQLPATITLTASTIQFRPICAIFEQ